MKFAEVIEECASFPYGDHDDLVDSTTMAIMRFRQGGFLPHPEDYEDEKKNLGRWSTTDNVGYKYYKAYTKKRLTKNRGSDHGTTF